MKIFTFNSDSEGFISAKEFLDRELNNISCSESIKKQIKIACDEIISNIIKYAYKDEKGNITIKFSDFNDDTVKISFTDRGQPFNPLIVKEPECSENVQDRTIGGLGIFIVKKTMDDVTYTYKDNQNILTITKGCFL